MMIKLVILDFDDTLCLTEKDCFNVENEIAAKMGFKPMTRETHIKNWGKPLQEAIVERLPGIDAVAFMNELEKAMPEYVERGVMDSITDANLQTLDKIKESNKKLAILTSRTFSEVKHLLDEAHVLNKKIDAFYHKDNTGYVKPNPKVFDKVLQQFTVLPNEAVYIGDSISDAVSAKEAGLYFIALLESQLRTKKDFEPVPVDYFANKFQDILKYIN